MRQSGLFHTAFSAQQAARVANSWSHDLARPPHDGPLLTQSCLHLNGASHFIYHLLVAPASGSELPRHSLSIQPKFASQHSCFDECIQSPGFLAMYSGSLPLNDGNDVRCFTADFKPRLVSQISILTRSCKCRLVPPSLQRETEEIYWS